MKKLIIRMGAPKCGTSILQSILTNKERKGELNKIGFTFPLELGTGLKQSNSSPLFDDFCSPNPDLTRSLNFLLGKDKSIIISDDKLFPIITTHKLNQLFDEIKSEFQEMVVLISIREPSDWLLWDYCQQIKRNKSNTIFSHHVVKREKCCDWVSYVSNLVKDKIYFRLVVCDYKNLFNCTAELLGVGKDFFSKGNEKIKTSFSLPAPAQVEARRIYNILEIDDCEQIKKIETIYQDFNLEEENKALLKYFRKKNEGYVEKIKALKDVFFYEG